MWNVGEQENQTLYYTCKAKEENKNEVGKQNIITLHTHSTVIRL